MAVPSTKPKIAKCLPVPPCGTHPRFGPWLKNPANRRKWTPYLVASVSLSIDGGASKSVALVLDRMKVIAWLMRLFGWSFDEYIAVVPLSEFVNRLAKGVLSQDQTVDPNKLITMRTADGGDRLGVMVPVSFEDPIPRAQSAIGATLPFRSKLSTALEGDRNFLVDNHGLAVVASEHAAKIECKEPITRTAAKLEALMAAAKCFLQVFTRAKWDTEARESGFTKHVEKMSGLVTQASSLGEANVVSEAGDWAKGLESGKNFMRAHRDWAKSNFKHGKLMDCFEFLTGFQNFLSTIVHLESYPTFDLLVLKCGFFDKAESSKATKPLSDALRSIFECEKAFESVVLRFKATACDAAARFCSDAWLRQPVFHVCVESLRAHEEITDPVITGIHEDFTKAATILAEKSNDVLGLSSLKDDVRHLAVLVECVGQPSGVSSMSVKAALKRFGDPQFKAIRAELEATNVGQCVFSAAETLLQETAKDNAGMDKLRLALKVLLDDRLPRMELPKGEQPAGDDDLYEEEQCSGTICNFELISELGIVDIVQESLNHVEEAMSLLSKSHLEHHASSASQGWAGTLVRNMIFYDESLAAYLQAVVCDGEMSDIFQKMAQGAEINATSFMASFQVAWPKLESRLVDEEPFRVLANNLVVFFENLPGSVKGSFAEFIKDLKAKPFFNSQARSAIVVFLRKCAGVGELPRSGEEAVSAWKAAKALANADKGQLPCFLGGAIGLVGAVNNLKNVSFNLGSAEGELNLLIEERSGQIQFHASFTQAKKLPSMLCRSAIVPIAEQILRESVSVVVSEFVQDMHLATLRVPVAPPSAAEGTESGAVLADPPPLTQFISGDVSESIKCAAKSFGKKRDWPCDVLYNMLVELLDVVPQESCQVSLRPFCVGSCGSVRVSHGKQELLILLKMLRPASKIGMAVAYVSRYATGSDASACVANHRIKEDIELAVAFIKTNASEASKFLEAQQYGDTSTLKGLPLLFSESTLSKWSLGVQGALVGHCRVFMKALIEDLEGLANEVAEATPRVSHICNDTAYHAALCKKHILGWPSRKQMNEKSVQLSSARTEATRLWTRWQLGGDINTDAEFSPNLVVINDSYENAKSCLRITAGLSVLLEQKGEEQVNRAGVLVAGYGNQMPKALLEALKPIAAKAAAPPAKRLPAEPAAARGA